MLNVIYSLLFSTTLCLAIIVNHDDYSFKLRQKYAVPIRNSYFENSLGSNNYVYYTYPKYEYEYDVSDSKTGDHKKHRESRDGDVVKGEYSFVEPDGNLRRVEYEASDAHGFNAHVSAAIHKHGHNAFSKVEHKMHHFSDKSKIYKVKHFEPEYDIKEDFTTVKPVENPKKNQDDKIASVPSILEVKPEPTSADDMDVYTVLNKMKEVFGEKMVKNVMNYLMDMKSNIGDDDKNVEASEGSKVDEEIKSKPVRSARYFVRKRKARYHL